MSIFPPPSLCYDPAATRLWLVAVMVGLTLVGTALLVQVGALWRGMTRGRVAWWQRLLLVLQLVWAGLCAFDAALAFVSYGSPWVEVLQGCPDGGRCTALWRCLPPLVLRGPAQVALIGAICLLLAGWLALSAFARRIRAA